MSIEEITQDNQEANDWLGYLIKNYIRNPGQHMLEIGRTGTGKTQFLYWNIDLMREYNPKETIMWNDIGKGAEILTLIHYFGHLRREPINIITPIGGEIRINPNYANITYETVLTSGQVWDKIKPGQINIISLRKFWKDRIYIVQQISELFNNLIWTADSLPKPFAIFYDEFHNVAPSHGYGFAGTAKEARMQAESVNNLRANIEELRSEGLRIVATTHGWTKLQKGIRSSFEWLCLRRGAHIGYDDPKLKHFNPLWRKMATDEAYISVPVGWFMGPLRLPYYTKGYDIGTVDYINHVAHTQQRGWDENGKRVYVE